MSENIAKRIRDRIAVEWLTPSQKQVWDRIHQFSGPPHRIINIYGAEGTGKSFLGWLMEREGYATYCKWPSVSTPGLSRLVIDNAPFSREKARELRPLVDKTPGLQQIILLSRVRVDEQAMPAFELQLTDEDWDYFRANLYRHMQLTVAESSLPNFKKVLQTFE